MKPQIMAWCQQARNPRSKLTYNSEEVRQFGESGGVSTELSLCPDLLTEVTKAKEVT